MKNTIASVKSVVAILAVSIACTNLRLAHAEDGNLLASGNFESMKPWQANDHLQKHGQTTLMPTGQGVLIHNPTIDLDAALYQDIATQGQAAFAWSARIRGGGMMRASLAFVSMDARGETLAIETPTKVQGTNWRMFQGTVRVPPATKTLRVVLAVLDGSCSFAKLELRPSHETGKSAWEGWSGSNRAPNAPKKSPAESPHTGFSVNVLPVERPYWELSANDLDGDGRPEIVGCDVDGIVTVRHEGNAPLWRFDAGALVYQFAAADLDGDGESEILFSSVDPKLPLRAVNLRGETVRTFAGSRGPERLAAGDMDGDGVPEIAASIDNQVAGSGIAGGLVVYDRTGHKLWVKERTLRNFAFADWLPGGGQELVIGGPDTEFTVYGRAGDELKRFAVKGALLEQFEVADIDGDGSPEIVALYQGGASYALACHNGTRELWDTPVAVSLRSSGSGASALIACADFDAKLAGKETVVVGLHVVTVVNATGEVVYQSRGGRDGAYWEMWVPGGINSPDIACWAGPVPQLFLSSSRLRHPAYYRLEYGKTDEFKAFKVPDQEKHLEALHASVKARAALPMRSSERIKVFMALGEFARVPEAMLRQYSAALKEMETPALEYLVMYEASDLLGHERGQKMTTDQIVERARLFEETGIPFGYFATHGGQVWITREAIRRSKEAAPRMFRFLYVAENLETLYSPLYKDVLKWTDEALDFCAAHGMKMIFKEKHDVWGLLPADPEVFNVLFGPGHRETTVPIWSTNQPYQPEIQLGGMLGLKSAGLCREFGMSTQYWNWHEWGRYPRGIRDVSPTYVCPADVILRLELMGVALGGTWVHIEGGQTYLESDPREGVVPLANRHRELVYEMVRKNLFVPGALPVNVNRATVVRTFHPGLDEGKAQGQKIAYPYYGRNTEALRRGFIPARYLFEPYAEEAFPRLAYAEDWNVRSCFPRTPYGWVPVLPPAAELPAGAVAIHTDGERVRLAGEWQDAVAAAPEVVRALQQGAAAIPLQAPGACLVLQHDREGTCTALLLDPGYLAPQGVDTTLTASDRPIRNVADLITGATLAVVENGCRVAIESGAFRLLQVQFGPQPDR
jgi:hypothetical protein